MDWKEKCRLLTMKTAKEKGLEILELKSGGYLIIGKGIKIHVADLAWVMPRDLDPNQRGFHQRG